MGNGNNRMDCRLDGGRTGGRRDGSTGGVGCTRSVLVRIVALGVVMLASAGPAMGQFTVQPMKLDLQVTPGKLLPQVIEIQNIDPNESHTIDLTLVDLTQSEDGGWEIIEPNSGVDTSKLFSLKDSIRLSVSSVTVDAGQHAPVEVTIRVPRGSRGFSCAGILASIRPRPGAMNPYVLRFMVPVIVQIAKRTPAHKVQATDVGMEFVEAGKRGQGSPATTLLSMSFENNGATFPRTRPVARVWSWAGGHWRVVTTTGFQDISSDIGIIPGAKLKIKTDMKKSLPPGKYKIAGVLYVDGRRTKRVEKIIDFAGDPDVKRVAADTPLDLRPDEIMVRSLPGATRTTMLKVYNGSDETVNVQATVDVPRELADSVLGNVRGADMGCASWVKIEPEKFTLRGEGGVQNVRITTAMPHSATKFPNYYANVHLWAFYPDGQNAGVTTAKLCVQNTKIEVQPKAAAISMNPYVLSGSKYHIAARFNNPGITHFKPLRCKAAVTSLGSTVPRTSAEMTSEVTGYMLPFEYRSFSGVLDFSMVPAGDYRLSVAMQYAEDLPWEGKQAQIRVTVEDGRRIVETTGVQEELKEILEVQWSSPSSGAISGN